MSVKCKKCGSFKVASIRKDEDWGYGGDCSRINDEEFYKDTDLEKDSWMELPDIDIYWCLDCDTQSDELLVEHIEK